MGRVRVSKQSSGDVPLRKCTPTVSTSEHPDARNVTCCTLPKVPTLTLQCSEHQLRTFFPWYHARPPSRVRSSNNPSATSQEVRDLIGPKSANPIFERECLAVLPLDSGQVCCTATWSFSPTTRALKHASSKALRIMKLGRGERRAWVVG